MNAIIDQPSIPRLTTVYGPFRQKMGEYQRLLESDPVAAERAFTEATAIAKAFWAGFEYARSRE